MKLSFIFSILKMDDKPFRLGEYGRYLTYENLMRAFLILIFMLFFFGCNGSSDAPEIILSSAPPANPDWALPVGDHRIDNKRPPIAFVASIGGHFGPSFKVEMIGNGNLMYHQSPNGFIGDGGTSEEILMTEDMWNQCQQRLNNAELWKWRRRYDDPTIADGTVWKLRLEYYDQSIVSSGSNAYPTPKQFEIFLDAVSDLAEGNPFE